MGAAHDRVRRLAVAVQGRQPLPEDLARWLEAGLEDWLAQGGRPTLDACLGLKARGVRSLETVERQRQRDAALALCIQHAHDGNHRPPEWRARYLVEAANRFDRKWRRIRHCEQPPTNATPLERALFRAFATGEKFPRTPEYIVEKTHPGRRAERRKLK